MRQELAGTSRVSTRLYLGCWWRVPGSPPSCLTEPDVSGLRTTAGRKGNLRAASTIYPPAAAKPPTIAP